MVHGPWAMSVKRERKVGGVNIDRRLYGNYSGRKRSCQIWRSRRWKDRGRSDQIWRTGERTDKEYNVRQTRRSHSGICKTTRGSRNTLHAEKLGRAVCMTRLMFGTGVTDALLLVSIHLMWKLNETRKQKTEQKRKKRKRKEVADLTIKSDAVIMMPEGGTVNTQKRWKKYRKPTPKSGKICDLVTKRWEWKTNKKHSGDCWRAIVDDANAFDALHAGGTIWYGDEGKMRRGETCGPHHGSVGTRH